MKIGLLGGSFDPPHFGHIGISKDASKILNLDEIWWLLTKQNPLKTSKSSGFDERLALCSDFVKDEKNIIIKDLEKNLKSSYLIDSLNKIIKEDTQNEFILIIGADNLVNFHQWHKWQEILNLVKIAIFDRENYLELAKNCKTVQFCQELFKKDQKERLIFVNNKKYNISSTQLRNKND